ncbi:hypothetical protein GW17_00045154 [Ensete ventricosum]|nr:hypothetical protein GW17_00045154 [Ensete ventricosum]
MYFPMGSRKSMVSLKNVTIINFVQCHAESSFDRFFLHLQGISKYWPFPMYLPIGSRKSMVSLKNVTVINFAQCCTQSRVSISFSCTIKEFQNTSHSQRICPWAVLRAWFR